MIYTTKIPRSEYSVTDIILLEIHNRLAEISADSKGAPRDNYRIKTEIGEDTVTLILPNFYDKEYVTERGKHDTKADVSVSPQAD